MKTILSIEASPRGSQSASRKLAASLIEGLRRDNPGLELFHRDLSQDPPAHLSAESISGFFSPADTRSPAQAAAVRQSDELVDELIAADAVVISAPVWNFGLPASLKAWIDQVARAGRTFQYSATGPQGLLADKPVYVIKASGGVFSEGPSQAYDFFEGHLRHVLGFLGLKNVTFIRAEGLSLPGQAQARLQKAQDQVSEIVRGQSPVAA